MLFCFFLLSYNVIKENRRSILENLNQGCALDAEISTYVLNELLVFKKYM